MTKKDWEKFAQAFRAMRNTYSGAVELEVIRRCELQIADVLACDSSHFDAYRFLTACAM
jgi:hypothetical protein